MTEKKYALLIASFEYDDPYFRRLEAPAQDVKALARVLGDPAMGGFGDVKILPNAPSPQLLRGIEDFLADRTPEDLLLLYFSGHGVKDEGGRLYYATKDTLHNRLVSTALPAYQVNHLIEQCRSRCKILVLDCCYSGAFSKAFLAKGGQTVGVMEEFKQGEGLVTLTASDAFQYSFEEEGVGAGGVCSVFTRALVDGIETGKADKDGDQLISLEELYDYAYERVRRESPSQTPRIQVEVEGKIVVARNPQPPEPAELPSLVREAIGSVFASTRLEAIDELGRLLHGRNKGLALAAREALLKLTQDDSLRVRSAAQKCVEAFEQEEASRLKGEQDRRATEEAEAERRAAEGAEAEALARERGKIVFLLNQRQLRMAAEKVEEERLAGERAEAERRIARQSEAQRLARAKAQQENLATEKTEQERLAEEKVRRQTADRARAKKLARRQGEREGLAREKVEAERQAVERAQAERVQRAKAEHERLAREKAEQERLAQQEAEATEARREELGREQATHLPQRELADLIGARGVSVGWRRTFGFWVANLMGPLIALPFLAPWRITDQIVWVATDFLILTACTLGALRWIRNWFWAAMLASATRAFIGFGWNAVYWDWRLGANEWPPVVAILLMVSAAGIGTLVFLAALELSLRRLRSLWLALFVGSEVASVVRFLLSGGLPVRQSAEWSVFGRTPWVFFLYPVVFASVFWLDLRLLKKRDEILAGTDGPQ